MAAAAGQWVNSGRSDRAGLAAVLHRLPANVAATPASNAEGTPHSTLAANLQDSYFWYTGVTETDTVIPVVTIPSPAIAFGNPRPEVVAAQVGIGGYAHGDLRSFNYDKYEILHGTLYRGVTFGDSGKRMYATDSFSDVVYEYRLRLPYDINGAVRLSATLALTGDQLGIALSSDGTKLYGVIGTTRTVYQYNLASPWQASSSTSSTSITFAAGIDPGDVQFKSDGTKMYISDLGVGIREYTLSTAWDVTTAVFSVSYSTSAQTSFPYEMTFSPDGTRMFIQNGAGTIFSYTLSTAWLVTSATYDSKSFALPSAGPGGSGLAFSPDGQTLVMSGYSSSGMTQYALSTAWDITTTYFPGDRIKLTSTDSSSPRGITFSPDGANMYFGGDVNNTIYRYTLSTPWEVRTATSLSSKSISAQDVSPVDLEFSPDGLQLLLCGDSSDSVHRYTLTTAWDITTANAVQSVSFAGQTTAPVGFAASPDGLQFYVMGGSSTIYRYAMSSPWDLSTATYSGSTTITGLSSPYRFCFAPDGSKMYAADANNGNVAQYSLSTAYDLTTQSRDVGVTYAYDIAVIASVYGFAISADLKSLYLGGANYEYIVQPKYRAANPGIALALGPTTVTPIVTIPAPTVIVPSSGTDVTPAAVAITPAVAPAEFTVRPATVAVTVVIVRATAPNAPRNFRLDTSYSDDGKDQNNISLIWDPIVGAIGYDIERNGTIIVTNNVATTYLDTGLTAATEYTYRIRSVF